jgi:hypothetical protein
MHVEGIDLMDNNQCHICTAMLDYCLLIFYCYIFLYLSSNNYCTIVKQKTHENSIPYASDLYLFIFSFSGPFNINNMLLDGIPILVKSLPLG